VEEIDNVLAGVAASCRFSSPRVRSSKARLKRTDAFGEIYSRLEATEAKWFTRLILKDFSPVVLEPQAVYRYYDGLLPQVLRIQNDFSVAVDLLRARSVAGRPACSPQLDLNFVRILKPQLGVKVGRQPWFKARSIKHCMDMGSGRMSCEKKIDGEYCQIHIDLSKGARCIQIFSKSGKDSTADRSGLHRFVKPPLLSLAVHRAHPIVSAIRESLGIGKQTCRITKGCILEGELVVYSEKVHSFADGGLVAMLMEVQHERILPFHKIRRHVVRSGVYIGTGQDSR